ncbi:hypothetical protein Tco_0134725 [Tanacetum coccineum]
MIKESKDLSSLALDELIGNLKIHEVIMKKDFEICKGKREKVKSIALKAKKESSDDETSSSGSEEYAMVVRDFKKFFRRKGRFIRQPRDKKKTRNKRLLSGVLGVIGKMKTMKRLNMGSLSSTTDVVETDVATNIVKSGGTKEHISDVMLKLAKYLAKKKGTPAEPSIILPSLPRYATTMTPAIDYVLVPSTNKTSWDCHGVLSSSGGGGWGNKYSKEEEAEAMAETMEQYMSKTRTDYGSGVFSGSDYEDANEHIEKVLKIVDLFHVPNITEDQLMLRVFPISLTGAASRWLRNEPTGSIKTLEDLKTKFLNKYCPPGRTAKKMEEINNFQQEPNETFIKYGSALKNS